MLRDRRLADLSAVSDFADISTGVAAARRVAWADRFEDQLEQAGAEHPAAPLTCALGLADTIEETSLMLAAARARRRMEVIQTVRKLRRARERGS